MNFPIHEKERIYFGVIVALNVLLVVFLSYRLRGLLFFFLPRVQLIPFVSVLFIASIIIAIFYVLFAVIPQALSQGHIRGNGIRVNDAQFPDVIELIQQRSSQLGLATIPTVYILQQGGLLDIVAHKLVGTRYLIISSRLLEAAYEKGADAVEFVVTRELACLQRKRALRFKKIFTYPARLLPFLGKAYARACEHTYDAIAHTLCPKGAELGIALYAAGADLHADVKSAAFRTQPSGAALFLYELFSKRPSLKARMEYIYRLNLKQIPGFTPYSSTHFAQSLSNTPNVPFGGSNTRVPSERSEIGYNTRVPSERSEVGHNTRVPSEHSELGEYKK